MATPRELALKILYDIEKNGAYLNISFQNHTEGVVLTERDVALLKELTYGVMKYKLTLDSVIARFSSVKLKKLAPFVLCILRLGLYQLYFMDKIPESAAVNESVKLAGRYAGKSRGFINAILRRAAKEALTLPEGQEPEALSVRYSHPLVLVRFLLETFGAVRAEELMAENNQTPALCVRVNTFKTSKAQLMQRLKDEGASVSEGTQADGALLFESGGVQKLSSYKEGLFTIQDQSAQLAALALDPQPGNTVFDVCAAPGGKTTHLAELMENQGEILALDVYEKRLLSVTESAKRLGLTIIKTQAADAATYVFSQPADKILIDAPCSGLGVIRRRPDIKYKPELTDFSELVSIQKNILNHCADFLKPGGEMVYSTCTINPGENENQVMSFLQQRKDFELVPIDSPHIIGEAQRILQNGMGTFYPEPDGGDGFFIAKLRRRNHG
ncbi:MAG: 16S rRNA (cytosine(967)-C(5))-methyltransferase RsmB [Clostridia bacterium]|nr:16S rRNA (cytosine(967)-C(5))-methyltransferase RsmB [Clostridia bacterium]